MRRLYAILLFVSFRAFAYPGMSPDAGTSEISLGLRHIVIVQADAQHLWASYYFGVYNNTTAARQGEVQLHLPKEATEFLPGDSLKPQDIQLSPEGNLVIKKEFNPGLNLASINFRVGLSSSGSTPLSFQPASDMEELSIAAPLESQLQLESKAMDPGLPTMLQNGNYKGLLRKNIKTGDEIAVLFTGTPQGREPYWLMALGIFVLLISCAMVGARMYAKQ